LARRLQHGRSGHAEPHPFIGLRVRPVLRALRDDQRGIPTPRRGPRQRLRPFSHGGLCENAMKGGDKAARQSLSKSKLKDALYTTCKSLSYMTYLIKWLRFIFPTWPRIVASRDVQRRR